MVWIGVQTLDLGTKLCVIYSIYYMIIHSFAKQNSLVGWNHDVKLIDASIDIVVVVSEPGL